ncbi:hypothetical protein A3860_05320 [Niastella vici]|uniref:Uncharacterized protein n=1 Tax=Niastella vici TaxID=1703345 RepID=A0A1V9FRX9_9BACT|nr:hypothetical protein A3860_05320 [Niastella vici]
MMINQTVICTFFSISNPRTWKAPLIEDRLPAGRRFFLLVQNAFTVYRHNTKDSRVRAGKWRFSRKNTVNNNPYHSNNLLYKTNSAGTTGCFTNEHRRKSRLPESRLSINPFENKTTGRADFFGAAFYFMCKLLNVSLGFLNVYVIELFLNK